MGVRAPSDADSSCAMCHRPTSGHYPERDPDRRARRRANCATSVRVATCTWSPPAVREPSLRDRNDQHEQDDRRCHPSVVGGREPHERRNEEEQHDTHLDSEHPSHPFRMDSRLVPQWLSVSLPRPAHRRRDTPGAECTARDRRGHPQCDLHGDLPSRSATGLPRCAVASTMQRAIWPYFGVSTDGCGSETAGAPCGAGSACAQDRERRRGH